MGKQRFWGFLAHTSIIVGTMFVIFFVIDRFNPAMEFLSSSISKWLILFFAVCSIGNGLFAAVFLFQRQKRHEEKRENEAAKIAAGRGHAPQQRQYDPHERPQQRAQSGYGYAYSNGYPAGTAHTAGVRTRTGYERRDPHER